MREILFRGKRIDNCEWVYGDLVQSPAHKVVQIFEQDLCGDSFSVDPSTVGQYTGLTANDKKIFEGDILKITDEFGNSVIWSVDCKRTAFSINQKGVNYSTYLGEYDTRRCDIEIIGNIYDTPELFEVKE